MPFRKVIVVSAASLCASSFCLSFAEDRKKTDDDRDFGLQKGEVISLIVENDLFGGADRNYSNGVRLEYHSAADEVPDLLKTLTDAAPFIDIDQTELRTNFGLAHAIFTPEDIEADIPDPTDRPYAGWLYISQGAVATAKSGKDQHALQLNIGVVGPSAGGKFVQRNWHELIDGKEPRGWDAQLSDELGIELIGERMRRLRKSELGPFEIDSAVYGGWALGNVHTYVSGGAMARIGFDLDSSFAPPRIRPALGGAGAFNPHDPFGGYVFLGAEGRYVARNIFLDGNTFDDDGPSVSGRRRWVGDIQTGIALNWGRFQTAFTYVHRTEQFIAQDGPDRFGAVSISYAH